MTSSLCNLFIFIIIVAVGCAIWLYTYHNCYFGLLFLVLLLAGCCCCCCLPVGICYCCSFIVNSKIAILLFLHPLSLLSCQSSMPLIMLCFIVYYLLFLCHHLICIKYFWCLLMLLLSLSLCIIISNCHCHHQS